MDGCDTPMADYLVRVVKEKKELDTKIKKLHDFMRSGKFDCLKIADRDLIFTQLSAMVDYSFILGRRIERFTN